MDHDRGPIPSGGKPADGSAAAFDAATVEGHRPYLLRYAMLQLRDATAAEDAVQETLLAALQSASRFGGRSSVRTWLTGILKHKIIDHVRRQTRERRFEAPDGEPGEGGHDPSDAHFSDDGHWADFPDDWPAPDKSLENAQFWRVFDRCVQVMPERAARVFVMREVMELSTEEICKALGITATNCWVMLHRARLSLRECLEIKWFKA